MMKSSLNLRGFVLMTLNLSGPIEQTTKTPLAVRTRLGTWGRSLAKILDLRFDEKAYRITT